MIILAVTTIISKWRAVSPISQDAKASGAFSTDVKPTHQLSSCPLMLICAPSEKDCNAKTVKEIEMQFSMLKYLNKEKLVVTRCLLNLAKKKKV